MQRPSVLITGHAGFTGPHVVQAIREREPAARICGFDTRVATGGGLDDETVGDLGDCEASAACLDAQRPTHIIQLAGRMPPASDAELWHANVGLAVNLCEALCRLRQRPRVLVIGSAAEYGPVAEGRIPEEYAGRPTTTYGRTKLVQTWLSQRYAASLGLPIMIARPFNLFGPGMSGQTVIGAICEQLVRPAADGRLHLGNVASARDFVDIRDAAAAYWGIVEGGQAGEIYNVCSGRAASIRDIIELLCGLVGQPREVEREASRLRAGDVAHSCGDGTKLERLLGRPVCRALEDSLRDTLREFQEYQEYHVCAHRK